MDITFSQYLTRVAIEKERHPERRMGETYFNVLRDVDLELSDKIIAKHRNIDPFHNDNKIGDFLSYIYVVGEWAK